VKKCCDFQFLIFLFTIVVSIFNLPPTVALEASYDWQVCLVIILEKYSVAFGLEGKGDFKRHFEGLHLLLEVNFRWSFFHGMEINLLSLFKI